MKRVAHVVNQFFAGIGGEEKADVAAGTLDTLAGPSRGLQRLLQGRGGGGAHHLLRRQLLS